MSIEALTWWSLLCAVRALNVLVWLASATNLRRRQASFHPFAWASIRLQMLLSAGCVLGCAHRSVVPVHDVRRFCLVDPWRSSIFVGRSVATVAELGFAVQRALLLRGVSTATWQLDRDERVERHRARDRHRGGLLPAWS